MFIKSGLILLIAVMMHSPLSAKLILPHLFSDNMVLQRNAPVPVWGWAGAHEKVMVKFHNQVKTVKADKEGKWMVKLDPEMAGGPYELIVKERNSIVIKNVLVGEVWVCSGQSNMEWSVGQSMDAAKEISGLNNPFIRHIKIPKKINSLPNKDFDGAEWQVCDSTTVAGFSGIGYFFARNIYNELKIPIGIINASWGGTNIETWISREGFESSEEFREMIEKLPNLDLDSLTRLRIRGMESRVEAVQGTKMKDLNPALFPQLSFDDAHWPSLNLPQIWEQQRIGELDGVVWLRKTIDLSASDLNKEAMIALAAIDDADITYVNGVEIGRTNQWDTKRNYRIPAGVLKEGKNLIAVRVVDNGGSGGIYGDPSDMKLKLENSSIPLSGDWKFQVVSVKKSTNENALPSLCYNAMVHPLIPFSFQGVLWYQGESNAGRSYQYRKAFPLLINDWRKKWNRPGMPFYFVQLATYSTPGNSNEGCGWAELREAQTMALKLPNTGICVTTDIGNPADIHPTNKQEVGRRLASVALHHIYERRRVYGGPQYRSMTVKGSEIELSFDQTGTGLYTPDKYGYIRGFEIAGEDRIFHYARAFIRGNTVVVISDKVVNPVAVHFGWVGDASDCNLFNREGFPAMPFRTDEWKTITKGEKYTIEMPQ